MNSLFFKIALLIVLGAIIITLILYYKRKLNHKLSTLPINPDEVWALCLQAAKDEGGHDWARSLESYIEYGNAEKKFVQFMNEHGFDDLEAEKILRRAQKDLTEYLSNEEKLNQKLSLLPKAPDEIWGLCQQASNDEDWIKIYGENADYVGRGAADKRFVIFLRQYGFEDLEAYKILSKVLQAQQEL